MNEHNHERSEVAHQRPSDDLDSLHRVAPTATPVALCQSSRSSRGQHGAPASGYCPTGVSLGSAHKNRVMCGARCKMAAGPIRATGPSDGSAVEIKNESDVVDRPEGFAHILSEADSKVTVADEEERNHDIVHMDNLLGTLLSFQRRSLFCDTVLMTRDGGTVFAHSAVLAAVCPSLLTSLNQNPFTVHRPNVIDLSQFEHALVVKLTQFFYTGRLGSPQEAIQLRELFNTLGVSFNHKSPEDAAPATLSDTDYANMDDIEQGEEEKDDGTLEVDTTSEELPPMELLSVDCLPVELKEELDLDTTVHSPDPSTHRLISLLPCADRYVLASEATTDRVPSLRASQKLSKVGDIKSKGPSKSVAPRVAKGDRKLWGVIRGAEADEVQQNFVVADTTEYVGIDLWDLENVKGEIVEGVVRIQGGRVEVKVQAKRGRRRKADGPKPVEPATLGCTFCEQTFVTQLMLDRHKWVHYKNDAGLYECKICTKTYRHRPALRQHVRAHTQTKPFMCTVCGHCFINRRRLKSHINTHTDARPNMCDVCGLCFNDNEYLTKHKRHHRGDKRHLCGVCGKSFFTSNAKSNHMRTHTGERPYQCAVCGSRFTARTSLKFHMLGHTGERPFACTHCTKCFQRSTRLKQHVLNVHTENSAKPFPCALCGRGFSIASYLKQHMLSHSGTKRKRLRQRSTAGVDHQHSGIEVVETDIVPYDNDVCLSIDD